MGIRPASMTAWTWFTFPAVMLDRNQTASCKKNHIIEMKHDFWQRYWVDNRHTNAWTQTWGPKHLRDQKWLSFRSCCDVEHIHLLSQNRNRWLIYLVCWLRSVRYFKNKVSLFCNWKLLKSKQVLRSQSLSLTTVSIDGLRIRRKVVYTGYLLYTEAYTSIWCVPWGTQKVWTEVQFTTLNRHIIGEPDGSQNEIYFSHPKRVLSPSVCAMSMS
jgi:hypothetical protein